MNTSNIQATMLAVFLVLTPACAKRQLESPDPWQYPIHIGDSRAKVHEFLSDAKDTNELSEEYPKSGVILYFASDGRLKSIEFNGEAYPIYLDVIWDDSAWIPSDRAFFSGLTARANEEDFQRILGSPVQEYEGGAIRATNQFISSRTYDILAA